MNNCDEDVSVFNGHYEVEVVIDRPIAEVWLKYLDIASWVTSHRIKDTHGEPGTVGSITRVSFDPEKAEEMGMPHPRYHYCKIIKLTPEKHYLLKTYSEKGGSYGIEMTAFDDVRFIDCGGKTKLIFNIYVEIIGESIAQDPDAMSLDISREGMVKNFDNLKRLCEET